MKIAFIVNPKSGKAGKNNEILKIVREFTRGRGLDANIFVPKHKGHPNRLAEDAKLTGFKRIIVVGGDGTINEVANAIVGSEIEIGIVPCGSGNGLARHLNIPLDVDGTFCCGERRGSPLLRRSNSRDIVFGLIFKL